MKSCEPTSSRKWSPPFLMQVSSSCERGWEQARRWEVEMGTPARKGRAKAKAIQEERTRVSYWMKESTESRAQR